jgi:hypothetical protein
MHPFEDYLKSADALAQDVVNAWGLNTRAGNAASLTPEFLDVFEKACRYQQVKSSADFFRSRDALLQTEEGQKAVQTVEAARRAFIEAYKPWAENLTTL